MAPHVSKGEKKVNAEQKKWVLANGSLLVMQGDTQENWKVRIAYIVLASQG
jgi:alkylated DNA repair dioxygenase AlkB